MRIPRIYHPTELADHNEVHLAEGAARHVSRVLRLGVGDEIILFDGSGSEFPSHLIEVGKRSVVAQTTTRRNIDNESPLNVTLAQGVSKGERMDYTIQKSVELGVNRIVPLTTERSVVNLKGERLEKRMSHWQGVIISACEQCGRNSLPELLPMMSLHEWLQQPLSGSGWLLDHRAASTLPQQQPKSNACILLIGPEGGLSEAEQEAARSAGYLGVRLGPRVLRTETAALTALAAIQSLWGDLG